MKKPLSSQKLFCLWLSWSCALIAADQWLKLLIVDRFEEGETIPVTWFFNLVRAHNTGGSFSLLYDAGGWQRWFFIGVAIIVALIILVMLWSNSKEKLTSFALSCILGGAVGNMIDRILLGHVVDFLDFHWGSKHFPAFNLADIAICTGAGLLILNELINLRKKRHEEHSSEKSKTLE